MWVRICGGALVMVVLFVLLMCAVGCVGAKVEDQGEVRTITAGAEDWGIQVGTESGAIEWLYIQGPIGARLETSYDVQMSVSRDGRPELLLERIR